MDFRQGCSFATYSTMSDSHGILVYDGRIGKLVHGVLDGMTTINEKVNLNETYNTKKALENVSLTNAKFKNYQFKEKVIIKSLVYDSYELVYRYEKNGITLFINARTA